MQLYTNPFVKSLFGRQAEEVVLVEGNKQITAGLLRNRSIVLASWMHEKGVTKRSRVVIAVPPGHEFVSIIYACMMLDLLVSIIDPEMGCDNYREKFKQFAPQFAFVDSRLLFIGEHPLLKKLAQAFRSNLPEFPSISGLVYFAVGQRFPIFKSCFFLPKNSQRQLPLPDFRPLDEKTPFLVIYTSGTLSQPKGVVHTYRSISESLAHLATVVNAKSGHAIATHLPHFMLLGINAKIKVFVWDNEMTGSAKYRFVQKHNITTLFGPPSDFVSLINFAEKNGKKLPKNLRKIILGSAPVYPVFLRKIVRLAQGAEIECLYGMTEHLMTARIGAEEKLASQAKGDLVGYPFPGVEVSVSADNELNLMSNQLYQNYWGQLDEVKIHATGDLGMMDEKGRLALLGRKKDMIIRGNFNIYPGLYEPTINKITGINEAVLVGIYKEEQADEHVVLVVDCEASLTKEGVLSALKTGPFSIDKQALPDEVIFMSIPHSGRQNKVDKKQLRERLKNQMKR